MWKAAVVIWLALAACGDSQEAKLAKVRDAVCACKTPGCAEVAMKDVPQKEIESNHRTQKIAREMLECLAKLYNEPRPSTDPDGDTDH